jgi:hypothetical protein
MQFIAQIWEWAQANPGVAMALVAAIYAFATKKLTLQGLFAEILKDVQLLFKPQPTPPPGPTPAPGPSTTPALDLLQQLIALLLHARASGDKELEDATMKLIAHTASAKA